MKDPDDVEISFGDTAIFNCHVEGEPPLSIVWMHDEIELPLEEDERMQLMKDGSLMIKNAKESDVGIYECMVKSPEGNVTSRPARMVLLQADAFEDNIINGKLYGSVAFIKQ